ESLIIEVDAQVENIQRRRDEKLLGELVVGAQAWQVCRRHPGNIQIARLVFDDLLRGFADHADGDRINGWFSAPVIGKRLERDVIAMHPFTEGVWPGADRML